MWYRRFINHEKFLIRDLDLKVSEEVCVGGRGREVEGAGVRGGVKQHKILDQYLTSGIN